MFFFPLTADIPGGRGGVLDPDSNRDVPLDLSNTDPI